MGGGADFGGSARGTPPTNPCPLGWVGGLPEGLQKCAVVLLGVHTCSGFGEEIVTQLVHRPRGKRFRG